MRGRFSVGPIFKPMRSKIEWPCLNMASFINQSEASLRITFFWKPISAQFRRGSNVCCKWFWLLFQNCLYFEWLLKWLAFSVCKWFQGQKSLLAYGPLPLDKANIPIKILVISQGTPPRKNTDCNAEQKVASEYYLQVSQNC